MSRGCARFNQQNWLSDITQHRIKQKQSRSQRCACLVLLRNRVVVGYQAELRYDACTSTSPRCTPFPSPCLQHHQYYHHPQLQAQCKGSTPKTRGAVSVPLHKHTGKVRTVVQRSLRSLVWLSKALDSLISSPALGKDDNGHTTDILDQNLWISWYHLEAGPGVLEILFLHMPPRLPLHIYWPKHLAG